MNTQTFYLSVHATSPSGFIFINMNKNSYDNNNNNELMHQKFVKPLQVSAAAHIKREGDARCIKNPFST